MASVTVTLPSAQVTTNVNVVGWHPGSSGWLSLGTSLSAAGTDLRLAVLNLWRRDVGQSTSVRIDLLGPGESSPSAGGDDFSNQMEMHGSITLVASDGSSVTITGIGDATEPYQWTPSNIAQVYAFANTVAGLTDKSLTVTFNDNSEVRQFYRKTNGVWGPVKLWRRVDARARAGNRVMVSIPNIGWSSGSSAVNYIPQASARLSLGASLSSGGGTTLYLSRLSLPRAGTNVIIQLALDRTTSGTSAGPEFSTQMENSGTIALTASNGVSLTLTGIGDSTEPYSWQPGNLAAVRAFANTVAGLSDRSLTATFDDQSAVSPWVECKIYRRGPGAGTPSKSVQVTIPNTNWMANPGSDVTWAAPAGSYVSLGTSLSVGGATALWFGRLSFPVATNGRMNIWLAPNQATHYNTNGPDFSQQMEDSGTITFRASNGSTLVVTGISDSTEPYMWTPSNADAVVAFGETLRGLSDRSLTVTFDDGSAVSPWVQVSGPVG